MTVNLQHDPGRLQRARESLKSAAEGILYAANTTTEPCVLLVLEDLGQAVRLLLEEIESLPRPAAAGRLLDDLAARPQLPPARWEVIDETNRGDTR